jgi:hypothetical protein
MSDMLAALNRLCKWRSILTGWHIGTQGPHVPGVQAMRDLQDFRLITRAELTALTWLLMEKGIITKAEWEAAVGREANELERMLQQKFPGYRATDTGMIITAAVAAETNKVMGFPP